MAERSIEGQAAEEAEQWLVHLESGEATSEDRIRFDSWFMGDGAHRKAYNEALNLCRGIAGMRHLAALEPAPANGRTTRPRFMSTFGGFPRSLRALARSTCLPAIYAGACIGVFAVIFTFWVLHQAPGTGTVKYATRIAEIRNITLQDGSKVTLGADSRLAVHFTEKERRTVLTRGEAFFSVAKDAARPFVVKVGETLVRDVGTRFNVNTERDRLIVSVVEGAVDVVKPSPGSLPFMDEHKTERIRVQAGQQVVSSRRGDLEKARPVGKGEPGSWRAGRLIYDDVPLSQVISDANRYSARRIVIGSKALGDLAVTAAFRTDQIDEMLEGLASLLPITVDKSNPGEVVLKSKR